MGWRADTLEIYSEGDYNHADTNIAEWDEWQAKRKSKRVGGEWKSHLRRPELQGDRNWRDPREKIMITCKCCFCGKEMVRSEASHRNSMKTKGRVMCQECKYDKMVRGWGKWKKNGRRTAG